MVNFNPHEREARDRQEQFQYGASTILIHTSVKLVTYRVSLRRCCKIYFNPHEREARDVAGFSGGMASMRF